MACFSHFANIFYGIKLFLVCFCGRARNEQKQPRKLAINGAALRLKKLFIISGRNQ